jgi:hypothetical protein
MQYVTIKALVTVPTVVCTSNGNTKSHSDLSKKRITLYFVVYKNTITTSITSNYKLRNKNYIISIKDMYKTIMNTPLQTVVYRFHVLGIRIIVCLPRASCCSTHIILTVKTSEQHSLTPMVFSTLRRCVSGSSRPIFINSSHCMKEKLVTLQGVLI